MQFRSALVVAVLGVIVVACGKASAAEYDPTNPLHCALQFQSYSILAKTMGQEERSKGFGARSHWYLMEAKKTVAPEQLKREALVELGNKIVANPDGGLALASECMKRQDADEDFQRVVRKAKEAIAAGIPPSTPMHEVSR